MSLKITRLQTYWSAEEAHSVIEFLEVLREQLWEHYGEAVVDMLRQAAAEQAWREAQGTLEFDDEIKF